MARQLALPLEFMANQVFVSALYKTISFSTLQQTYKIFFSVAMDSFFLQSLDSTASVWTMGIRGGSLYLPHVQQNESSGGLLCSAHS